MTESNTTRWAIPFAVSYSKLGLIIRFIKNNDGATRFVPLKTIYNLTSINHQLLKANTSFCQITGILEGDPEKGYKLTSRGAAYAEALTLDKPELIKKTTLEIIKNSHLNDLKTFVDTEGDKVTKEGFFKNVKNKGNISDGKRFGQMPPAYSTGTGTLLEMFAKAELLPTKLIEDINSAQNKTQKSPPSKPKKSSTKSQSDKKTKSKGSETPQISQDTYDLQSNTFLIKINKKIESDELDLIKSQIDGFLKFVEKKITSEPNQKSE